MLLKRKLEEKGHLIVAKIAKPVDFIVWYDNKLAINQELLLSIFDTEDGQQIGNFVFKRKPLMKYFPEHSKYFIMLNSGGYIELWKWNPFTIVNRYYVSAPQRLIGIRCSKNGKVILLLYPEMIISVEMKTQQIITIKHIDFQYDLARFRFVSPQETFYYCNIKEEDTETHRPEIGQSISISLHPKADEKENIAYFHSFKNRIMSVNCNTNELIEEYALPSGWSIEKILLSGKGTELIIYGYDDNDVPAFLKIAVKSGIFRKKITSATAFEWIENICSHVNGSSVFFHTKDLPYTIENCYFTNSEPHHVINFNKSLEFNLAHLNKAARRLYVSYKNSCVIHCFELIKGQLIQTFTGHQSPLNGMLASKNNDYLYTTSPDGTIREWNTKTARYRLVEMIEHANFYKIMLSEDEKYLIVGYSTPELFGLKFYHRDDLSLAFNTGKNISIAKADFAFINGYLYYAITDRQILCTIIDVKNKSGKIKIHSQKTIKTLHRNIADDLKVADKGIYFVEIGSGFYFWRADTGEITPLFEKQQLTGKIFSHEKTIFIYSFEHELYQVFRKSHKFCGEIEGNRILLAQIFNHYYEYDNFNIFCNGYKLLITDRHGTDCLACLKVFADNHYIWYTIREKDALDGWFCGCDDLVGVFCRNTRTGKINFSLKNEEREAYLKQFHHPERVFRRVEF
jgi:WD40 repeat protein